MKRVYLPKAYLINVCSMPKNAKIYGDVSVVQLEQDITFSPTVQPACLHSELINYSINMISSKSWLPTAAHYLWIRAEWVCFVCSAWKTQVFLPQHAISFPSPFLQNYRFYRTGFGSHSVLRKHESTTVTRQRCRKLAKKHKLYRELLADEVCSTSNKTMACIVILDCSMFWYFIRETAIAGWSSSRQTEKGLRLSSNILGASLWCQHELSW